MKANEKEILELCRKLVNPCTRALTEALSNWMVEDEERCTISDIVESLDMLVKIRSLLGYKEDEIQEKTTVKNYKLFEDDESKEASIENTDGGN